MLQLWYCGVSMVPWKISSTSFWIIHSLAVSVLIGANSDFANLNCIMPSKRNRPNNSPPAKDGKKKKDSEVLYPCVTCGNKQTNLTKFTWIFWGVDSCSWWPLFSRCYLLGLPKAFDSVPYQRLLGKIKSHGNEGKWLSSFLHNYLQRVILNSASSHWTQVKSGVPQRFSFMT